MECIQEKECMVPGCGNRSDQGNGRLMLLGNRQGSFGLRWICEPCYIGCFKRRGGQHSQVYRNIVEQYKMSEGE